MVLPGPDYRFDWRNRHNRSAPECRVLMEEQAETNMGKVSVDDHAVSVSGSAVVLLRREPAPFHFRVLSKRMRPRIERIVLTGLIALVLIPAIGINAKPLPA